MNPRQCSMSMIPVMRYNVCSKFGQQFTAHAHCLILNDKLNVVSAIEIPSLESTGVTIAPEPEAVARATMVSSLNTEFISTKIE